MSESNNIAKEDLTEAIGNLAGMIQQEFISIRKEMKQEFGTVNKRLDSLEGDMADVKQDVADIKQTNRVLVGEVAEVKVAIEDQQHERRIHILELENQHKENRLRKVEQTVGLVK